MDTTSDRQSEEVKFRSLRKFNIAMGFLHMLQGGLMLALANAATLPIQKTLLGFDPSQGGLYQVTETVLNLRLGPFVAMFLFVSMIAHFAVSSPWGYEWYVRNLKKGINYARWYEYAVSSSIMVVVIAMLCGIYELSSLILIFLRPSPRWMNCLKSPLSRGPRSFWIPHSKKGLFWLLNASSIMVRLLPANR